MKPKIYPPEALEFALTQYRAGAYRDAAETLAALRLQSPDAPVLLRLHGLSLVRANEVANGVKLLARAYRAAPDDPLTALHLSIGLHAKGALRAAAHLLRVAIRANPSDSAPFVNLAVVLLDLAENDAALDAARNAVTRAPGSPDAQLALARAATACNDPVAATHAFNAYFRLKPCEADAMVSLAAAQYRFGQAAAAINTLEQALTYAPGHAVAETNLAAFLALRGEQDNAVARLRDVVARAPDCVAARLNLANLLLQERAPADALSLLSVPPPTGRNLPHWHAQRAAALHMLGRDDEARTALAAVRGAVGDAELRLTWLTVVLGAEDDPRRPHQLQRIAELADTEGAALPEHRIIAHFDLASVRVRAGDRPAAFTHWCKGHALLARLQPFSREAYADFIAAIMRNFDRNRLHHGARAANTDPAPVFIVGMPRSGTTLTEQILAAHCDVHAAGERFAVHNLILDLAGPPNTAQAVMRLASLDEPALSRAAEHFLAELHALAPEQRLIADKMPGNAMHLGFLATLLPGARVIRCTRDPRDIGLSIFQRRFFGYHPYAHDLRDLGWYIARHNEVMCHWHDVLPIPLLTIALEDWVNDFDLTLARMLAFLGLPPDPACARFYELDRRIITASRDQVRRPVNAQGIGRWRHYEAELAPLIAELPPWTPS